MYKGELLSLITAVSWTATALFAETASKRMGSLPLNVMRMLLSLTLLALTLFVTLGYPYPVMADSTTWMWLSLSGFVGYALGDYCLFQSYVHMNARFGQLFMTLSSPSAALAALVLLGERMSGLSVLGMMVTLSGISMSILSRGSEGKKERISLKLPLRGVLYGIGAGMGQGVGLVLSKIGMRHYEESLASYGVEDLSSWVNPDAIIPVSLDFMMPFASTLMRAVCGFICFSLALYLWDRKHADRLGLVFTDRKVMLCTLGAAIFGPFVGVSLSLMATLYTSAGIAQTIMALTPVLIIAPSWLLYHQKVTPLEVIGAIISVVGASLFFI